MKQKLFSKQNSKQKLFDAEKSGGEEGRIRDSGGISRRGIYTPQTLRMEEGAHTDAVEDDTAIAGKEVAVVVSDRGRRVTGWRGG